MNTRRKAGCAVLMAMLLGSVALAGCKKEETAEQPEENTAAVSESAAVEENTKPESPEAGADKTVLLDSDIVQLTLNGVSPFSAGQEDDGTTKTADPEVEISFDVMNKGEDEIVLDLRDLKVGETPVKRILMAGDVAAPGDTMTFRYGILPKDADGTGQGEAGSVSWELVSEQGLTGTVRVMNIEGELAQAEFSTAG